jgi:hypothetical protein
MEQMFVVQTFLLRVVRTLRPLTRSFRDFAKQFHEITADNPGDRDIRVAALEQRCGDQS